MKTTDLAEQYFRACVNRSTAERELSDATDPALTEAAAAHLDEAESEWAALHALVLKRAVEDERG